MTVDRGIQIGFAVVAVALIALGVTLAFVLGGGDDGTGAGSETAPAATEAPATETPANLEECLEQQGLEDLDLSDPHGSGASQEDLVRFFQNCAQFLHEGAGP